ncbi:MAG: signal peptidase I [Deltaproteobacteria bacterium]|nr:signal peptidase I [Deltaproteobacteria bacterium]
MLKVGVAVASVLLPGVGHALAGFNRRGIAWLVVSLVATALVAVTVWALVGMVFLRIAGVIDALWCTRAGRPPTGWAPSVGLAVAGIVGVNLLRFGAIEAFKMPSSSMTPTLLVGDHIYVNKLATPDRGDIIVFQQPCTLRDYIKRVVAVGGDTVEVRCDVLHINGKAIPNTLDPAACSYDDHGDGDDRWSTRDCSRYRETLDGAAYDVLHDAARPARDRAPRLAPAAFEVPGRDFPDLSPGHPAPSCSSNDGDAAPGQPPGTLVARAPTPAGFAPCDPQLAFRVPADAVFVLGDNRANSHDSRYWGVVPIALVRGRVTGIWYSPGPNGQRWSRFGAVE